ncbi:uncharacterized protein BDCG_07209 [Blastomyces dermatitidis ER-3]|uniref:Hydrophobin n=1 Tax=Ajellomyces dermatitidis (strain ER-3 / ATCC MYA-2586) TaxID=559297 RepID=A0ABP2F6D4_AJEDR|nr:uncharacterized protein BDCG_07209 [Blastomyces dermatitidis ER-3]EEQ92089.2 hypothetical protein BDCG_07209 [Blastomyces dermatitidis ER-3]
MQLQLFLSAFAFISTVVNAVALPPHSGSEVGSPLAVRSGGTSSCNSVPQCCQSHKSSDDKTVIQGLKIFGLDKEAKNAKGGVATQCKPITGVLNLDLLNGCKSNAVCCSDNKMNGLIFLGCVPITLNV